MQKEKVVMVYNGELYASAAVKALANAGYDVIAVCIDTGGSQRLTEIRTQAIQVGANSSYLIDAKNEFAEEYAMLFLQAHAFCEKKYPFVSLLSRPLIAKKIIEIAEIEKASIIAHDIYLKNMDDKTHFEKLVSTINPHLRFIDPIKLLEQDIGNYSSGEKKFAAANSFVNESFWGREVWGSQRENYEMTAAIEDVPDEADWIEIEFEQGVPIAINGKAMKLPDVYCFLNKLAGKHGIGRIDPVDNHIAENKTSVVYECPGAITLLTAHQEIENNTIPEDIAKFKPVISQKLIELIEEGVWFTPVRKALEAFIKETQKSISGTVSMKLYKGQAVVMEKKQSENVLQYSNVGILDGLAVAGFND